MTFIPREEQEEHWTRLAGPALVGKRVTTVRYLTVEEAAGLDWTHRPLVITFEDGSYIFPSQDDEGNNGGALFGGDGFTEWTFPVLR
jgi:hypothetical protein